MIRVLDRDAMNDLSGDSNDASEQLRHLRDLLVGPTRNEVRELRNEFRGRKVTGDEVGQVLAEAIQKSPQKRISRALGPMLSSAFQDSVTREPQKLVDAISPIMGPAIRRAISQQIQAMVQSLNTALDHSFSPRGIRWRIESIRTGKSFAEIVLLHTLIYRIEQLLLIDPKTGLLMQYVSADRSNDADIVSSLLSAIQDFTRDSFEHSSDDESSSDLRVMKTNELTVWIEHGPSAILALAVRGEPPVKLREKMQELLERLHIDHGTLLRDFQGDTAELALVQPDLEELLLSEFVNQNVDSKDDAATKNVSVKTETFWEQWSSWLVPVAIVLMVLAGAIGLQRSRQRSANLDVPKIPFSGELQVAGDAFRVSGIERSEWTLSVPDLATLEIEEVTKRVVVRGSVSLAWLQKLHYAMDVLQTGYAIDATQVSIID